MRAWGANVATGWPVQANPPAHDQNHTRAAYAKWLHAQQNGTPTPATHTQFDTEAVLPYYAYLAATGAFLEIIAPGSALTRPRITCLSSAASRPRCATRPAPSPIRNGTCRHCQVTPRTMG